MKPQSNREPQNASRATASLFGPLQLDFMYGILGETSFTNRTGSTQSGGQHDSIQEQPQSTNESTSAAFPQASDSPSGSSISKEVFQLRDISKKWGARSPKYLGCNTCRKRKVKCNKLHPICGHCSRLNLDCTWRQRQTPRQSERYVSSWKSPPFQTSDLLPPRLTSPTSHVSRHEPGERISEISQTDEAITDGSILNQGAQIVCSKSTCESGRANLAKHNQNDTSARDLQSHDEAAEQSFWANSTLLSDGPELFDFNTAFEFDTNPHIRLPSMGPFPDLLMAQSQQAPKDSMDHSVKSNTGQQFTQLFDSSPSSALRMLGDAPNEILLLKHFVEFTAPPILTGNEPSWSSTRGSLIEIAKSNAFVRHAICAFSNLSLEKYNNGGSPTAAFSLPYYEMASRELFDALDTYNWVNEYPNFYEGVLASIFFLSYVELITTASPNESLKLLRRAHEISRIKKSPWSVLGKRFRIWLRLLDIKAILAGGEGIYLSSSTDIDRVEGS